MGIWFCCIFNLVSPGFNKRYGIIFDGFVRGQIRSFFVIPAKAGIQEKQALLDPGFRRGDASDDFLRMHHLDDHVLMATQLLSAQRSSFQDDRVRVREILPFSPQRFLPFSILQRLPFL